MDTNKNKKDMLAANRLLLERDIDFSGIEIVKPSLNDIFIRLTSGKEGEHGCS